jgi:hypothetical protein
MMEAAKELAGPAWKGDNRILYYDEEQWEECFGGDVVGQGEAVQSSEAVAQGSGVQADGQDLPLVQSEQSASQARSNVQGGPAPIGTAAAGSSKAAQDTAVTSLGGEAAKQAGQQVEHQQGSHAAYDARGGMGADEEGQEQTAEVAPSSSTAGGLKRKREEVSSKGNSGHLHPGMVKNSRVVLKQHLPFSSAVIS